MRVAGDRARPSAPRRLTWRRGGFALAVVLGALLLAGCQTRALVRVSVKADGSGTIVVEVHLDKDAARQVGDLGQYLAVDDLRKAGWKITGPGWPPDVDKQLGRPSHERGTQKGSVLIHLEHSFADVDGANALLSTLSGPDGPFEGLEITRSSSLTKTEVRVRGNVDLSKGLDTFGDPALTEALGAPLSEVVGRSGGTVPSGDDLVVSFQVESDPEQPWNGPAAERGVTPELVQSSASLGARGEPVDVTTSWTNRGRIALVVFAGVLSVVVLVVIALVAVGRRRRRVAIRPRRPPLDEIDVPDPFA